MKQAGSAERPGAAAQRTAQTKKQATPEGGTAFFAKRLSSDRVAEAAKRDSTEAVSRREQRAKTRSGTNGPEARKGRKPAWQHPQGVRRIRMAAKPPTAAQSERLRSALSAGEA